MLICACECNFCYYATVALYNVIRIAQDRNFISLLINGVSLKILFLDVELNYETR
jgi:hypothetical protein